MLKRLGDRDEGDAGAVEHLDQLREVHQRARQPVDLVDHDDVDQPLLDVGEQLLQPGPLQRAAGEAAVVVGVADQRPALRALAGDVGLAGLALGLQRVELLVEALLGRLAGVDRAAELADRLAFGTAAHAGAPLAFQAEEDVAVPPRVGNRAGDRRERAVRAALPLVAFGEHRDGVLDTLPLTDQPGPGDRHRVVPDAATGDVAVGELIAQRLEPPDRLRFQPAEGQLLDAVGQPALEKAAVVAGRLGTKELAPLRLQLWQRHGLQRGQPGGDRVGHATLRRGRFA